MKSICGLLSELDKLSDELNIFWDELAADELDACVSLGNVILVSSWYSNNNFNCFKLNELISGNIVDGAIFIVNKLKSIVSISFGLYNIFDIFLNDIDLVDDDIIISTLYVLSSSK